MKKYVLHLECRYYYIHVYVNVCTYVTGYVFTYIFIKHSMFARQIDISPHLHVLFGWGDDEKWGETSFGLM